jgi:hypothetical protein
MTSTVLTPYLGGPSAIDLSGTWRKRLLPVGDVAYKGRMLHFTREYLQGLAAAFRNRAYDQVPLQLAGADNSHTNDVERTAGQITDMTVEPDGLYITARVSPRGEAVLAGNPLVGVSARIVEDYDRSDGRHFPAAVQHALVTLDPRIPALGAWQAVEASNDGGMLIDLSACRWAGEPLDFGSAYLADASPWEIAAMDQALAEYWDEMTAEAAEYGLTAQEWEQLADQGAAELAAYEAGIELAAGRVSDGGYDSSSEANPTMDGVECPNPDCQILNNFAAKFCSQCGTPMPDAGAPRNPPRNPAVTGDPAVAGLPASAMRTLSSDMLADLDTAITLSAAQADSRERTRRMDEGLRRLANADRTSTEDRLARAYDRISEGTYVPGDQYSFTGHAPRDIALSSLRDSQTGRFTAADVFEGATSYGIPCGPADAYGRCMAAYHSGECSSLADIGDVEAYKDELRITAMLPANQSSDATYSDFIEQNSGVKLSHNPDYSIWETGASKPELISIGKRQIHGGDPDADEGDRGGFSAGAGTARTVSQAKVQMGLERPPVQRAARLAEAALRMPAPRHPDYTGVSTGRRAGIRAGQMRELEDSESLSGSLPVYSR